MAYVSNTSPVPGTGTGILMPKMAYRFRVEFFNKDNKLDVSDALSQQAVAVSAIQRFYGHSRDINVMPITLYFEDDVASRAANAVDDLALAKFFDLHICELDDAGNVLRTCVIERVQVQEVLMSDKDYSASGSASEPFDEYSFATNAGELGAYLMDDAGEFQALRGKIVIGKKPRRSVSMLVVTVHSMEMNNFKVITGKQE